MLTVPPEVVLAGPGMRLLPEPRLMSDLLRYLMSAIP